MGGWPGVDGSEHSVALQLDSVEFLVEFPSAGNFTNPHASAKFYLGKNQESSLASSKLKAPAFHGVGRSVPLSQHRAHRVATVTPQDSLAFDVWLVDRRWLGTALHTPTHLPLQVTEHVWSSKEAWLAPGRLQHLSESAFNVTKQMLLFAHALWLLCTGADGCAPQVG